MAAGLVLGSTRTVLRHLFRKIAITREAALGRQAVHAREKPLQPGEIGLAFPRHEFLAMLLPRVVPPLGNHFRRRRDILARQEREPRTADEPFVLSGRHEEVPPDGPTHGTSVL